MDENTIYECLKRRNEKEKVLSGIVGANAKLLSTVLQLKAQCLQLERSEESLRIENADLRQRKALSVGSETQLQQTLETQQELMKLYRERGEKNQEIIDLKNKVQENELTLTQKETVIATKEGAIEELERKNSHLEGQVDELSATNQMLKDEQQALQLEFVCMQEKYTKLEDEHNELIKRWLDVMKTMADRQNEEIDKFHQMKQQKMQNDLKDAMKQEVKVLGDDFPMRRGATSFVVAVPTKMLHSQDVHDSDINDVKWSPSGRLFATAGADRKVKLWEISNQQIQKRATLTGSNGGVLSLDFDMEPESLVLAASSDFACHIWGIEDQRHRHTLTGHSNKVYCAKFMEDSSKVVSGSHDRTLKQWDLRERACVRTMFAGSSCNSVVTVGSMVISGHFDKKVRFWDKRADQPTNEIILQGKITSLDMSADRTKLLCCTREPSLKLVDLRMNQVVSTFTAPSFHVGADYTKAIFSPDAEYVCCGSSDGSVFIWNVSKGKLEKTLKEHGHTVNSCSWSPSGNYLVTGDSRKKAILWSDF